MDKKINSIKRSFTILTQEGERTAKGTVFISVPQDREYPKAEIRLTFDGKTYVGRGTDEFYARPAAQIREQLPEGIEIACCMTCRYGNECIYGNIPEEYYCFRDVSLTAKEDLIPYSVPEELNRRLRDFAYYCPDWQPQSPDYYTYNEFSDCLAE